MQHIEASNSKPASKKYREIITKAICGNAKKFFRLSQFIDIPEGQHPTDVLGTTITMLELTNNTGISEAMSREEPGINISGTFEVHVWYAHKNSTDVARQNVQFEEIIPISEFEKGIISLVDAKVEIIKSPECLESTITKDNKIKINVELGVYAEIVGETKVSVCIYEPNGEEDDD
ncbi:spore coat protein E [Desulfotomaculum arcticum]|uniref:Spore coat protein E n=1 Tax=Desulfotruncus arcticus DSM 17038 TaxID=1121424 RepID=A0A1I2N3T6_9FIRM|nr:outer spore coat protein CotE [Desulfotruncus arcticus]SFF98422.1 spore coat protein E [Desulfotomaculum arcticum] [Desulfotruncus arcticus DSM 17038]